MFGAKSQYCNKIMLDIFSSILPIFIIMFIGNIIKYTWLKSEEFWRGLESLSYFLLFPVMLFSHISDSELSGTHLVKLMIILMLATTLIAFGLVILQKKYEIDGKVFTSIFQGGVRYNSYIFFALGSALYGEEGMEVISVIAAYMIIYTNILSILAFTIYCPEDGMNNGGKSNAIQWDMFAKSFIMNPLIIASILGFSCNYLNIEILTSVKKTLDTIATSAHTIGLLCVGASLKLYSNYTDKFSVSVACLAKLIIMPALTFIMLKLLGMKGVEHSVCMLYSTLPPATNSYLLSKQMGGDADVMTSIITISIILSPITLALFIYGLA
ncbi:MAG: AEC family transporter [Alphaproteobacteria bacterium]|nr:AEC family transporter [Alphaproteobacteria bacterium]